MVWTDSETVWLVIAKKATQGYIRGYNHLHVVRMTKSRPTLAPNERAIKLKVTVPEEVFSNEATVAITVAPENVSIPVIEVEDPNG